MGNKFREYWTMMVVLRCQINCILWMEFRVGWYTFRQNMQIELEFVFRIYEMARFRRCATINFMEYL